MAALIALASAHAMAAPIGNDDCASSIPVGEGSFQASNRDATTDGSATCGLLGDTGGRDLWWAYTPSADGMATLDTCGSGIDTILSIYTACGGSEIACNDDQLQGGCGSVLPVTRSRVDLSVAAGATYLVRVAGWGTQRGDITLNILLVPDAPFCGDGACNGAEDTCSCPLDGCLATCGDGCCSDQECPLQCSEDCASLLDFAEFQVCFSGPSLASQACAAAFDADENLSVNLADYVQFLERHWPEDLADCE